MTGGDRLPFSCTAATVDQVQGACGWVHQGRSVVGRVASSSRA